MLTRENLIKQITYQLSCLEVSTRNRGLQGLFDQNVIAEQFFAELLNTAFGYNLKLLPKNQVGVDLRDCDKQFVVQVTSTSARKKIQKTIYFVREHKNYAFYRLKILIIGKKPKYKKPFAEQEKIEFDPQKDIWDIPFILNKMRSLSTNDLHRCNEFLKLNLQLGKLISEIKSLLPIQKALAAQSDIESNRLLYGQIFWPDVNKLYKRDECEKILQLFESSNVVLLEGYPASGKSSIACRLAWELVKKEKLVYYGNLTTQYGLKCSRKHLSKSLLDECENVAQEVFIIIEDIHHLVNDKDADCNLLNSISDHKHIKLLLTSRPLIKYYIEGHFMIRPAEGAEIFGPFRWISPSNRLRIKTDREVVKKILDLSGTHFDAIEPIMERIGKDEPDLIILRALIHASSKKNLKADKISMNDILNFFQMHLEKLAERVCGNSSSHSTFFRLLGLISVLSEFEIPVEKEFLDIHFDNKDPSSQILRQMEKQKEVIRLQRFPGYKEFYLIPHSKSASLYRRASVRDEERFNIIKRYILEGTFFGRLTPMLLEGEKKIFMIPFIDGYKPRTTTAQGGVYESWTEEEKLLEKIISKFRAELTQRDLSHAEVNEIWHFLFAIGLANEDVRKEIVNAQKISLISKDLSQAGFEDIRLFLSATSGCKGSNEIVNAQINTLKNRNLSKTEHKDIGIFLSTVSYIDKDIACEILNAHRDTIEQKFSYANFEEFESLLIPISEFNEAFVKEILASNRDNLNRYFSDAYLDKMGKFISRISNSNKVIAREILNAHTDVIKHKLSQANLKEIRRFLDEINRVDEDTAREIAKTHTDVLGQKLSQASLTDIGEFLKGIGQLDTKVYREIYTKHKAILNQELSNATLEHIGDFVSFMCIASRFLEENSRSYGYGGDLKKIINARKKEREIKQIANEVLHVHRDVLGQKLSQAGLKEIGEFLVKVKRSNELFASEIAHIHKDVFKNKEFSKVFILDIGAFLAGICQANDDVAKEIVNTHRDALDKKIAQSTFDDLRLTQLGMFFLEISRASKKLAEVIVNSSEDILKRKDISQSYHGTIGQFLAGISSANKELAIDIADDYRDVLNQKLLQMDLENIKWFFETVEKGDKDFASHIINILRNSIRQKLSEKSLKSIRIFIKEISQSCKKIPKKIVDNLKDILEQKISQAGIRETNTFIGEIYKSDKQLAKNVVDSLGEILKHKDLSQTSILGIGWYLEKISKCNKECATQIAKNNKDILLSRDLSQNSIDSIGWFLSRICLANKEIASEVSERHSNVLKNKDISQSDISEIGTFLEGISLCNKSLANEIINIHEGILKGKFDHASPGLIAVFLLYYCEDIASEIIKINRDVLKNKDLSQVGLEDIREFLKAISKFETHLAKEISNMHRTILKEKLSRVTIKEIGEFIEKICSASKDVGREIVNSQKDALEQKLQKESLEEIRKFLEGVNEADTDVASEIVDIQKVVIGQKLTEANHEELIEFLSGSNKLIYGTNIFKKIEQNHSQILQSKRIY
jgi:hypothetical protein